MTPLALAILIPMAVALPLLVWDYRHPLPEETPDDHAEGMTDPWGEGATIDPASTREGR